MNCALYIRRPRYRPRSSTALLFLSPPQSACNCATYTPRKVFYRRAAQRKRGSATQWISFAQSEIEAYLWHSFRATRLVPGLKSDEFPISFNNAMAQSGLQVLASHMNNVDYLLGKEFSVVDIVVGWTVNWAIKLSLVEPESPLHDYIARLKERKACALS